MDENCDAGFFRYYSPPREASLPLIFSRFLFFQFAEREAPQAGLTMPGQPEKQDHIAREQTRP